MRQRLVLLTHLFVVACLGLALLADRLVAAGVVVPLGQFFGRFHPLLVHLPIGTVVLLATLESVSLIPKLRSKLDPTLGWVGGFSLVTGSLAFALGLLLAGSGSYPSALVARHRTLTLAMLCVLGLSVALWSLQNEGKSGVRRHAYRLTVLGASILLSFGAHVGGSITHGERYLTQHAPSWARKMFGVKDAERVSEQPSARTEPLFYADVIAPLLERRCGECHGADAQKGGLRTDSLEALRKGGDSGPAILPGNSKNSLLVTRLLLPMTHEEHMPPEKRKFLVEGEIAMLGFFVDRGADPLMRVRDLLAPEPSRFFLESALGGVGTPLTVSSTPSPTMPGKMTQLAPIDSASPPSASTPRDSAAPSPSSVAGVVAGVTGVAPRTGPTETKGALDVIATFCVSCHGAEKQKGRLRLDSQLAMETGGKAGPALVMGAPDRSLLLTRMKVPLSTEDHMPPKASPQPSATDIQLVASWINNSIKIEKPRRSGPVDAPREPRISAAIPSVSVSVTPPAGLPVASSEPPKTTIADHSKHLMFTRVQPVLVARCLSCHEGKDGSLDMLASARPIDPHRPETSEILRRLRLPLHHAAHMPPDDKSQLTPVELALVTRWIEKGGTVLVENDPDLVPSSVPISSSGLTSPPAIRPGGCAGCAIPSEDGGTGAAICAGVAAVVMFGRRRRALRSDSPRKSS